MVCSILPPSPTVMRATVEVNVHALHAQCHPTPRNAGHFVAELPRQSAMGNDKTVLLWTRRLSGSVSSLATHVRSACIREIRLTALYYFVLRVLLRLFTQPNYVYICSRHPDPLNPPLPYRSMVALV